MADPRITDEALEPAARALYEYASPEFGPYGPRKDWGDDDWYPSVRQTWFDGARAVMDALPLLATQPDMCHNGHPFEPGVDTDMVSESRDPDPRWCNTCGEARPAFQRPAPQPVVDREALAAVLRGHYKQHGPGIVSGKPFEARCACGAEYGHGKFNHHLADAVLALLDGGGDRG